tara:strand:+ start:1994 stop:2653 length:660 start_codon:yes stop_codon:yes gene_type:complete
MTREEQLKFCKKCINRKLDLQVGLVCNLTGEKADFEDECKSFQLDDTVVEKSDNTETLLHSEIVANMSEENLVKFQSEQEFPKALTVGIIVGLLGAVLWGVVTVATGYQIGYMAVAIGAAVGYSMRITGKGIDQIFGISGGIIALVSCLLGNFFSIIGFIANEEGLGYFETLSLFDYSLLMPIMVETFSPMDLLFYGIAAFEGYKFSFRTFEENELSRA